MTTARAVADLAVSPSDTLIFRAGLWKPRTSPATFQGVGFLGLAWLQRVQNELHLPAATEVATPEQVRHAVQAGIAYLWVGARTAANPIAVQELADALIAEQAQRSVRGLFVKNPVNEDVNLWIGNIARLQTTAIPVMAVHRGCNHRPCWRMAYALRLQCPAVPLLLDPSHLSGDAARVPALCGKAFELGLDGLMVEVHPHPAQALSDSAQQLPLSSLLNNQLCWPTSGSATQQVAPPPSSLLWLRTIMDETDDRLWEVVEQRMAISRQIGDYKQQHAIPVLQPERFWDILSKRQQWAAEHGISPQTVEQIMSAIHDESIRHQTPSKL